MYPTSPTVQQWRTAAADLARASGIEVPAWYSGADTDIQRLNTEGRTDLVASLQWFQKAHVVEHPADFPDAIVTASRDFLAKNPDPGGYGAGYAREGWTLGDVADVAAAAGKGGAEYLRKNFTPAGIAESFGEGVQAVKELTAPAKSSGISWGLVIGLGIAAGAGAYYLNRKGIA